MIPLLGFKAMSRICSMRSVLTAGTEEYFRGPPEEEEEEEEEEEDGGGGVMGDPRLGADEAAAAVDGYGAVAGLLIWVGWGRPLLFW